MRRRSALSAAFAAALVLQVAACGGGEPGLDLAFVSSRDGDYALFTMRADGGGQDRLTAEEGDSASPRGLFFQVEPAWSPDGTMIAFASKRGGNFDLYTMNADGTGTRRVTSTRADDGSPTWSSDGRRIAFGRGTSGDIYVANVDGSGARALGDDLAPEGQPAWSPDGRWIAYVRRTPGTPVEELWVVRPDGSGRHKVKGFGGAIDGPTWSPDSQRIAFAADIDGSVLDIYSIGADGRSLRRHTQSPNDAIEPSWSPDGNTIAFSREGSIVTIDQEGEVEVITDAENNDSSPAWNPRPPEEES
jgi:Tol biopolymer transport system component